jgi:hypothetical protein
MESKFIPCFLCGEEIEIKNSKKGKPYFICDPCGLQTFIRRDKGIERLKTWMEEGKKEFKKRSGNGLLELVMQIEALEAKRKEIETKKGLVPLKETHFIEAALKKEIKEIKRQVRKVLKGKG